MTQCIFKMTVFEDDFFFKKVKQAYYGNKSYITNILKNHARSYIKDVLFSVKHGSLVTCQN